MSDLTQLFDHQAALQRELDQLRSELLAWVVLTGALVVIVGAMALELKRLK